MEYKSIRTKKIYEEVADALLDRLKTGKLKQGDKLDSVDRLAESFQVSRSAVREALSGLRAMGVVEMRQGEGTYISQFDASMFSIPVVIGLLMNRDDIKEFNEVRKILEVGAVRSAAKNHKNEDLEAMEKALLDMEQANGEGKIGEQADLDFHLAIVHATHNNMLINLIKSVSDTMVLSMRDTRKLLFNSKDRMNALLKEHQAIFEAIKSKDSVLADRSMLDHLEKVENAHYKYWDLLKSNE